MEIASAGVVGHNRHNPEIARRKPSDLLMVPYVVRLSWMLVSKVKLRFNILKINRAIVIIILGEGFPYSKSVISTTQLARLTENQYIAPGGLRQIWSGVKEVNGVNFETKLWCLLVVFVSKRKLQFFFSDTLLMEKNPARWYGKYMKISNYWQGFIHVRWCRVSSINSMNSIQRISCRSPKLTTSWCQVKVDCHPCSTQPHWWEFDSW